MSAAAGGHEKKHKRSKWEAKFAKARTYVIEGDAPLLPVAVVRRGLAGVRVGHLHGLDRGTIGIVHEDDEEEARKAKHLYSLRSILFYKYLEFAAQASAISLR